MQKSALTEELLVRSVAEVIVVDHLREALSSGKRLRVKFGIDPTAPDIHLGHTVALRKLRAFQDAGHSIILIIGDFTAMIGDPSGRSETRKVLSASDVKANMKKYLAQAGRIINIKKTEVHYNSSWYKKGSLALLTDIFSRVTVQRVLERDDFQKRLRGNQEISMLEIMYPLLQGYDSVAVKSDIEIGGTDQKFNMLMGRRLQRSFDMPEQDVMTLELVEGLDGVKKMSKSYGNYIGISDNPADMFGKVMSIPDTLMMKYFRAFTDLSLEELKSIEASLSRHALHPRDAKLKLAREIVFAYHGAIKARKAEEAFIGTFQRRENPENVPNVEVPENMSVIDFLKTFHGSKSNSEARRLIAGGGVKIDLETVEDEKRRLSGDDHGKILKVGKRHFYRIAIN